MNRFPAKFSQTGMFGAPEALLSESKYNPPSDCNVSVSPVTSMASQSDEEKKHSFFLLIYQCFIFQPFFNILKEPLLVQK